jgi:hypothetical protein
MAEIIPLLGPGQHPRPRPVDEPLIDRLERAKVEFQKLWHEYLQTSPIPSHCDTRLFLDAHVSCMTQLRRLHLELFLNDGAQEQLELAGIRADGGVCDNE